MKTTIPLVVPGVSLVASVLCSTVTLPITDNPSRTLKLADDVYTGAVVSVTLTVLVFVPAFPEASVDV